MPILLSDKLHSANHLAVLLDGEDVSTCISEANLHVAASCDGSSLASLSLSSHVNNLNVIVACLSKLYDNVLAYCVSLQLSVAELVDASAAADCDGREYALVLTE